MIKSVIRDNEVTITISGNEDAVLAEFKSICKGLLSSIDPSKVANEFFRSAFELNLKPADLFKEDYNAKK